MTETASSLVGEECATILSGLAPQLMYDLAGFYGQNINELCIAIQLMPFGDRATLKAYNCICEDRKGRLKGKPELLDIVEAAFIIKDHLNQVTAHDMARFLDTKEE